jgi:glycosyltransferase involved in cell wall biosynthesis
MRILLVHLGLASFVRKDLEILRQAHDVRPLRFTGVRSLPALWSGVRWSDVTFSWFGTIHALFTVAASRMLRRKSVVVSGGYDVAKTPLLPQYGPLSKRHKRWGIFFVFANADLILSVSEFNRHETIANAKADPARVQLVYHGFDSDKFRPLPWVRRERAAVTVGHVGRLSWLAKGLNVFAQSAHYLPDVPFTIVGPHNSEAAMAYLRRLASPNVHFAGGLYGDDLVAKLSSAQVYVQPSIRESFGCAVAEAMLCGCVPVVSRRGALPEVVGDCGFYVDRLEPASVAEQVERALVSDLGNNARQRVLTSFPLERRRRDILAAIEQLRRQ